MKKIAAILAALMLVLSLTSCSDFVDEFMQEWDEATTQTFTVKANEHHPQGSLRPGGRAQRRL